MWLIKKTKCPVQEDTFIGSHASLGKVSLLIMMKNISVFNFILFTYEIGYGASSCTITSP
jgi:hypothetical protein